MADIKPILIVAVLFLAIVLIWQVSTLTGFQITNQENITANVTVGNTAPTVGTITCTDPVTLTACTNTTTVCYALVTDLNNATDVSNVRMVYFKTASGEGADDPNVRYNVATCANAGNINYTTDNYTCTITTLRYYIDNTEDWTAKITATDASTETGNSTKTDVTINNLTAIDITETYLNFGALNLGDNSDPDRNATANNCGNYLMSINVSGTDLTCAVSSIPVANLKYNVSYESAYADKTALSATPTYSGSSIDKATTDAGSLNYTYWEIKIPAAGVKGLCTGNITFYGILGPQ